MVLKTRVYPELIYSTFVFEPQNIYEGSTWMLNEFTFLPSV